MFLTNNVTVTTIVTISTIFGCFQKFTNADAGLPLIQISHDELGDDYPEMQEQVHLEDFFWTGSGDGPPDYLKKVHTGISKGKEMIVKTETVVATVYVDGNNEVDIPICLDCFNLKNGGVDDGGGMPALNYSATDRRYWLLTVMSGFYTQKDNPTLEEKLARLYRLAFTRQQSRHLGINGAQKIASIAVTAGGRERTGHIVKNQSTTDKPPILDVEIIDMSGNGSVQAANASNHHPVVTNIKSELATSSEETDYQGNTTDVPFGDDAMMYGATVADNSDVVTLASWELMQDQGQFEKQRSEAMLDTQESAPQLPASLNPLFLNDKVRVVIHNTTQITADDVLSGNVPSTYDDDVNSKIDERPIANQTELIYSVFVNGRPVLAVTAANDMRLVSESEVRTVFGKDIFMKAEPYLREPMATPLAPATHSGSVGFIDSLQNNTALVVVTTVAILLLLLLLVTLLLVGKAKSNDKRTEVNRTTSQNELLAANQLVRPNSRGTILETERSISQSHDTGVQNFSYENEYSPRSNEPRIHFPGPPTHDSRRGSLTSTDITSDSSVYCPINPPTADVQRMLDEKASKLFDHHKRRRHHQYDRAEGREDTIYTTVVTEKKPRHKTKRRYLSENRVGSLETSPVQRLANSSSDDMPVDSIDALRDTNEAFNPNNNYHRNKLMHQKTILSKRNFDQGDINATEAINKEIIRALQPSERSSDTGSIGSFLSMNSVRAFPKSKHPEPLNRVLDPVFVTYYDNVDESVPDGTQQIKTKINSNHAQRKQKRGNSIPLDATTAATIENLPSPKVPAKAKRIASQSDNPDPGVVGPIVWERHKQRMNQNVENENTVHASRSNEFSPIRDPIATRNHYEGLLEGAIQMYSSQDDLPMPLPTRDFTNTRKPTKRENRGSSAGAPSYLMKSSLAEDRPSTAQPEKTSKSNHSTEPPSPTTSAWGGSIHGSNSTLLRPLSAGPFHRPASDELSAAPILEAIQHELRKFKQYSN